jgi:protein-L-isoaspartate(D-aspartate) O-methyltransferase
MTDFTIARRNMVGSQLRTNKVNSEAVLEAFESVPRELFLPEKLRGVAYLDEDIVLGSGRCMMEPRVLARLLQAARPEPSDIALDVGCGSGYAAAILARIVATVVAVESNDAAVETAASALSGLGLDNAVVVKGDITQGYPGQAPYNVILIGGTVSQVPAVIRDQLAEGGRLVAVVRGEDGIGRATLIERRGGLTSPRILFDAAVPPLPEFEPAPGFAF